MSVRTQARKSLWALLAGAAILARNARADTEAIRIEYQADDSCPSAAVFTAEVFQRTSSARLAADGEQARTFSVLIVRSAAGVTGSLVIRETDGATVARKVSGRSCEDVATVLALATALAIDPRAELDVGDAPAAPEPPPEPPPRAAPLPPRAAPLPPPRADVYEPSPPPPPPRGPWTWNGAVGPAFAFGTAPRTALGGSFLVEYGNRTSSSPLASIGVELQYLNASPQDVAGAKAAFQYYLARPRLCAFALGSADSLALAPCLAVGLGAVTGEGSNIPNEATRTRFWGSADALARLSLALGRVFFAEVEGGLGVPFTRYEFVFRNPDTQVYDVPAGVGLLAARLGVKQ